MEAGDGPASSTTDTVLSEVHLQPQTIEATDGVHKLTRFEFEHTLPPEKSPPSKSRCTRDEDGDAIIERRRERRDAINIMHTLETPLEDVGLQVWRGALVLGDYLLCDGNAIDGSTVLELGCGCALTGLLAATRASRVFLTDESEPVLRNAVENVKLNDLGTTARVRRLDWLAYPAALQRFLARADSLCVEAFSCGTMGCASENGGDGEEPAGASKSKEPVVPTDVRGDNDAGQGTTWGDGFSWAVEDVHELSQCTLVLGADVVYDVRATDALVHLLADLLRSLPHTAVALVALERRINFHLPSLSARAVAADHFAAKLREPANQLCAERIPIDFEQRFAYERVAQLELWRIKASRTVEPVEASEDQCR